MIKNYKITTKILFLSSILISLTMSIAIFSIYLGSDTVNIFTSTMRTKNNQIIDLRAQKDLFQARFLLWRYLAIGDETSNLGEMKALDQAKQGVQDLLATTFDASRHDKVEKLSDELKVFQNEINDLKKVRKTHSFEDIETKTIALKVMQTGARIDKISDELYSSYEMAANERLKLTENELEKGNVIIIITSFSCIIIGIFISLFLGKSIARPVKSITLTMRSMADGDLTVKIPSTGQKDELGEMAQAVEIFRDGLLKANELAAEREREQRIGEERGQRIAALTKKFDADVLNALGIVDQAVASLQTAAATMSASSEQSRTQVSSVAAATEQASVSVQTVASAAEELSSSIGEIARQVEQSSRISSETAGEAKHTNDVANGLAENSTKIGEVLSLISDIANQTNLLALNATIEAARAGEAGKGFAVVAGEVKTLAKQTANATEEIGTQVTALRASTEAIVKAIADSVERIDGLNQVAAAISAAVEEQSAATAEIARNVQQAAAGTQEISSNVADVAQSAAVVGEESSHVLKAAESVSYEATTLRELVHKYLNDVKVA